MALKPRNRPIITWGFVLERPSTVTQLVVRAVNPAFRLSEPHAPFPARCSGGDTFLMQRKQLLGIAARVEP